MNVTLFSYAKRANSTARPSLSAGTDFTCKLKEACSVISPELQFNLSFTILPQTYNYAYIPEFQRYYFIDNWTYIGRLWVASCVVDVLATYRSQILSSYQYVVRSATSSQISGDITDTLYPLTNTKTFSKHVIDMDFKRTLGEGTYVIGVINGDGDAMGCVSYYFMSQTEFGLMKDYLMKPVTGTTLSAFLTNVMQTATDISEGAVKALFNPLQYIASCYWIPYQLWHETTIPDVSVSDLPFGWWTLTGVSAERVTEANFKKTYSVNITLNDHPQKQARGMYMNAAPFTDYTLYLPPFGSIPLDGAIIASLTSKVITVQIDIDIITGNAIGSVTGMVGTSRIYLTPIMQAPLAIPIQLSQISMNLASDWKTTAVAVGADTIADLLGQNTQQEAPEYVYKGPIKVTRESDPTYYEHATESGGITKNVSTLASNIASAAKAQMTQLMSTGVNGNMASLQTDAYLLQVFYMATDTDLSHRGAPVCKRLQLSSLSGFTMVADPDISLAAPETEINAVKAFLLGGFYIQ